MELCLSLMNTPDSSSFLALFSTQLNNTCFLHKCSPFQFSTILFSIPFLMFFSSCISSTLAYCRLITVIWSIATSYNFCKAIPIWRTIINTCITHIYKCNIIIHLYKRSPFNFFYHFSLYIFLNIFSSTHTHLQLWHIVDCNISLVIWSAIATISAKQFQYDIQ